MGIKKRTVVKRNQDKKRRKERHKITAAGNKPEDYFSNGIRVKFD